MSHFYNPWKCQKTYGFLTFTGGKKCDIELKWINGVFNISDDVITTQQIKMNICNFFEKFFHKIREKDLKLNQQKCEFIY